MNPNKRGASLVEVGAREMSNVKEREGNVVVLHRRHDERFVRFIRAFLAITEGADPTMQVTDVPQPFSAQFTHLIPPRGGFILRLDHQ